MGYYTKKNHKYISREWVHGKWKYFYGKAKNAGNKVVKAVKNTDAYDYGISGEGYKRDAKFFDKEAEGEKRYADMMRGYYKESWDELNKAREQEKAIKSTNSSDEQVRKAKDKTLMAESAKNAYRYNLNRTNERRAEAQKAAANARQNYKNKSLKGITEKGANKLKSFLSSTEKAYVTDSKGHKRDVNPNDPLYKAIEEAGKKKKKR